MISVLDLNDNSPVFEGISQLNGTISEQATNGTKVKVKSDRSYINDVY